MLPMDYIKEDVSSIICLSTALLTAITKPSQAWTMSAQSQGKMFMPLFNPTPSGVSAGLFIASTGDSKVESEHDDGERLFAALG